MSEVINHLSRDEHTSSYEVLQSLRTARGLGTGSLADEDGRLVVDILADLADMGAAIGGQVRTDKGLEITYILI